MVKCFLLSSPPFLVSLNRPHVQSALVWVVLLVQYPLNMHTAVILITKHRGITIQVRWALLIWDVMILSSLLVLILLLPHLPQQLRSHLSHRRQDRVVFLASLTKSEIFNVRQKLSYGRSTHIFTALVRVQPQMVLH